MRFLIVSLLMVLVTQGNFKKKKCPHIKLNCAFKERNLCTKDIHCEYGEKCCMLGCGKKCYDSSEDICSLPTDKGPCGMPLRRWWYNSTSHTCQKFTFGGCYGNNNNFQTEEICLAICKALGKSKGPSQPDLLELMLGEG